MNTITACMNKAVKNGYVENFEVREEGLFDCGNGQFFQPNEVEVINFYRFEGQSDPADNAIMYVIETADGHKGTLLDAYGPYADECTNRFMCAVENIHKKVTKGPQA